MKRTKIHNKVVNLLVIASLCASFTACNNQKDDRIEPTTRVTESENNGYISEPNQSIASSVATTESESSETATTAPSNTGAYTYTAYGYQFTMDVNIDDYIFESSTVGYNFFDLYYLARDYGWTPYRPDGDTSYDDDKSTTVKWYEYDIGDGKIIKLQCGWDGSTSNPTGRPQLNFLSYLFRFASDGSECYEVDGNKLHWPVILSMPFHSPEAEWYGLYGAGTASASITREDAILLAYLVTVGPQCQGENPFTRANLFYDSSMSVGVGRIILPY